MPTDLAVEMGAAESHMASELEAAVVLNMAKLELLVRPELPASKELQKHLTVPLHMRTTDQLVRNANPITKARVESLLTPQSTAWLVCTSLFRVLAPPKAVAGMRRNLGVKLRREPCPRCHMPSLGPYHEGPHRASQHRDRGLPPRRRFR